MTGPQILLGMPSSYGARLRLIIVCDLSGARKASLWRLVLATSRSQRPRLLGKQKPSPRQRRRMLPISLRPRLTGEQSELQLAAWVFESI